MKDSDPIDDFDMVSTYFCRKCSTRYRTETTGQWDNPGRVLLGYRCPSCKSVEEPQHGPGDVVFLSDHDPISIAKIVWKEESAQESPRGQSERVQCAPLMDVANPELYNRNGFRVTGLAVDATAKEVVKTGEKLKLMEELNQVSANTNAFPIQPPPTIDDIREALQRLKDPEARLVDEFFWFWPMEYGQSGKDEAIKAYVTGEGERAFDLWTERKADPEHRATAYHNLAVVNHLMALEWTLHYMDATPDADAEVRIDAYWTTCIRYWKRTNNNDAVWDAIKVRIRSLDDARLTTGMARRMREVIPEALANINASFALKLIERGRLTEAETHIKYVKECGLSPDIQEEIFFRILQPVRDRFSESIQIASNTKLDGQKRFVAAKAIVAEISAISHLLQTFFGKQSHHRTELLDEAALACAYAATSYQKATGDLEGFLTVSREALNYATSKEARTRVQDNIDFGEEGLRYKEIEPFLSELTVIRESEDTPSTKLSEVKETIMPKIAVFIQQEGASSPVSHDLQTAVAALLRTISLDAYNNHDDLDTALEATNLAGKLARQAEMKGLIAKDLEQLEKFRDAEAKYNLLLQIKGDDIEINKKFFRYNRTKIDIEDIKGIRYGVFRKSTNGVVSSASFLIGIRAQDGTEIHIECQRMFRSMAQAQSDYEAILNSMFAHVIPKVVVKIAEGLISNENVENEKISRPGPRVTGRPPLSYYFNTFEIGGHDIMASGMQLSKSKMFGKETAFVPFEKIRYGYNNGVLTVVNSENKAFQCSFEVRVVWNAVIFEQILKALQFVKSKK